MDFYIMLIAIIVFCLIAFAVYSIKQERDNATVKVDTALYRAQADFYTAIRQLYNTNMSIVNAMSGYEFEHFVAELLPELGYRNVQVTKASGDSGADIVATSSEHGRVCIQCKNYAGNVGFEAVQQIYTARPLYACNTAIVITNSHFTKQAIEKARKLGVRLIDGDELFGMMEVSFEKKLDHYYEAKNRKAALLEERYGTVRKEPELPADDQLLDFEEDPYDL